MRRRIIVVLSIIAFAVLSIYAVKIVKSELLKNDIANSIKDFLNEGKYSKYLPDDQMIWLNNAKSDSVNNYDITEFVNYIIETSKKCVAAKIGEYNITEHTIYKRIVPAYEGITIVDMMEWFYTKPNYMMAYVTEEDIELYKNNKLEEKIHNELKNKLDYKDSKWFIGGNRSKKIDLMYGLYIDYTPDNRIESVKPKKVLKIKTLNNFIEKIGYSNVNHIDLDIKYIDNNNVEVDVKKGMGINIKDKTHFDLQGLVSLYYSYPNERTWPQLEIHHYSKDKEDEEYREWERANIKAEEERDPSTIEVDEQSMEIEMFKKYKQYAEIIISIYEDGSINSYFRKCESIVAENGKKKVVYMERELPYKNKPLLEVMKLYVNDKEQYTIDEELLKGNKPLVEYRIY